jgi:uncharacterized protein (TIGR03435 family)
VAKSGPKLKRVPENVVPEEPSTVGLRGAIAIKGKSTLDRFINQLFFLRAPIADKTGLNGVFEYEFILPQLAGRRGGPSTGARSDPDDLPAAVSAALEEQLGLRLQAERVLADVIVVDRAVLPSPN